MTFLAVIGAIVLTIVALWPVHRFFYFCLISDYGIADTIKWNWKKEKLWIEWILIPIFAILWWLLVGQHISIGFF